MKEVADGNNWTEIQNVKAAEHSTTKLYYEADDTDPLHGISYYRLKTMDLDRTFEYSKIDAVDRTAEEEFIVFYPNPASEILNIASSSKGEDIKFEMMDIAGKNSTFKLKKYKRTRSC